MQVVSGQNRNSRTVGLYHWHPGPLHWFAHHSPPKHVMLVTWDEIEDFRYSERGSCYSRLAEVWRCEPAVLHVAMHHEFCEYQFQADEVPTIDKYELIQASIYRII